ncbi:MAG: MerR family transcriptional regulator [Treponema sp.]|nr:MerR family transcriptional regulator [Treponema sp.]MBQ2463687.1 MerR family transcriptional regulator [Treponema sp.]MBQ5450786.1 MerR family transcriptional regulator [Treponema sp.]
MYTRGQFAVIGKVGRKALRIYDEEGLLVPASVDGQNGYHYYSEEQLALLEKIKSLRKIGLSLYEIKQVLDGKANEENLIKSKIREMDLHLKEVKEFAFSDKKNKDECKDLQVDIRPFKKCRCLYLAENVELENLGMSVGKLYEKAARQGMEVAGSHFVIYQGLLQEDGFSMKSCLPVKKCNTEDTEDTIEVFEESCIHIKFTEGFSKVAKAHVLLKEYAESKKIALAGKAYEVYNKDMSVDVYYPVKIGAWEEFKNDGR